MRSFGQKTPEYFVLLFFEINKSVTIEKTNTLLEHACRIQKTQQTYPSFYIIKKLRILERKSISAHEKPKKGLSKHTKGVDGERVTK